jgi:anti-anti-sigma regulatory factor
MSVGATVLVFPRSTNSTSRRAMRKELFGALRTSEEPVIVDLSGCQTLEHQDVNLLLDCVSQTVGRDAHLFLIAGSPGVRLLLDVIRISSIVPVFKTLPEALEFKQYNITSNIFQAPDSSQTGVVR